MKKYLISLLLLSVLVFSACNTTTPTSEITSEMTSEQVVVNDPSIWTEIVEKQEDEVKYYDVNYINGISDEYQLNANCTFKDLTDALQKRLHEYPVETFRVVFTEYFGSSENWESVPEEVRPYLLARLVSLSHLMSTIDDNGNYKTMWVYEDYPYFFGFDSLDTNNSILYDYTNNEVYNRMSGKEAELIETTMFDNSVISSWAYIINLALLGEDFEVVEQDGNIMIKDDCLITATDTFGKNDWTIMR